MLQQSAAEFTGDLPYLWRYTWPPKKDRQRESAQGKEAAQWWLIKQTLPHFASVFLTLKYCLWFVEKLPVFISLMHNKAPEDHSLPQVI